MGQDDELGADQSVQLPSGEGCLQQIGLCVGCRCHNISLLPFDDDQQVQQYHILLRSLSYRANEVLVSGRLQKFLQLDNHHKYQPDPSW